MSTSISMSLLARMERILRDRIGAKKEVEEKYDFQKMKHEVLFEHRGDIYSEEEKKKYSSELSRRFGVEGGKAGKGKKRNSTSATKKPATKKPSKKKTAKQCAQPELPSLDYQNSEFKRHMKALG